MSSPLLAHPEMPPKMVVDDDAMNLPTPLAVQRKEMDESSMPPAKVAKTCAVDDDEMGMLPPVSDATHQLDDIREKNMMSDEVRVEQHIAPSAIDEGLPCQDNSSNEETERKRPRDDDVTVRAPLAEQLSVSSPYVIEYAGRIYPKPALIAKLRPGLGLLLGRSSSNNPLTFLSNELKSHKKVQICPCLGTSNSVRYFEVEIVEGDMPSVTLGVAPSYTAVSTEEDEGDFDAEFVRRMNGVVGSQDREIGMSCEAMKCGGQLCPGEVFGCGITRIDSTVFWTRNGEAVIQDGVARSFATDDMCLTLSLGPGTTIKVNLGEMAFCFTPQRTTSGKKQGLTKYAVNLDGYTYVSLEEHFGIKQTFLNFQDRSTCLTASSSSSSKSGARITQTSASQCEVLAIEGDKVFRSDFVRNGGGKGAVPTRGVVTPNLAEVSLFLGTHEDQRCRIKMFVATEHINKTASLRLNPSTCRDFRKWYGETYSLRALQSRTCEYWTQFYGDLPYYHSFPLSPETPSSQLATREPIMHFPDTLLEPRPCEKLPGRELEVVARFFIPKGTCFGYCGPLSSNEHNAYTYTTTTGQSFDGQSVTRCINYFRGFADKGNVTFTEARIDYNVIDASGKKSETQQSIVMLTSIEDILPGQLVLATRYDRSYDMYLDRMSLHQGRFLSPREAREAGLTVLDPPVEVHDIIGVRSPTTGSVSFFLVWFDRDIQSEDQWQYEPLLSTPGRADGNPWRIVSRWPPGEDGPASTWFDRDDFVILAKGWDYTNAEDERSDEARRWLIKSDI